MDSLKTLKAQRAKINKAISKLEAIEEKRVLADAQKYVGTCYKYTNSISGGDKFFSYFKVTKVTSVWVRSIGFMSINVEGVQVDDCKDGYSIQKETTHLGLWQENPISKEEFERAYQKVLAKLS